jgi:SAM-dependent methyltransferase
MSRFSADWLDLRERADAAARATHLVARFAGRAARIVDLGAGTGANLRYLAPRLGGAQDWVAVDRDPALLGAVASRPPPAGVRVRTLALDLDRSLEALPLDGCDLVTASALLDLVSAAWLERLAGACATAGANALFALSYDGRIEWSPAEAADARVRELLNLHQLGDKGFGPALGPAAGAAAVRRFAALGYAMEQAASDWVLGPESNALQAALVEGWLGAALALAPGEHIALHRWATARRVHIAEGVSRLRVGHIDIAGTPPDA